MSTLVERFASLLDRNTDHATWSNRNIFGLERSVADHRGRWLPLTLGQELHGTLRNRRSFELHEALDIRDLAL